MTAADPTAPEPTHACVRCGRPVALSAGMCERCNPLGLADPAATQSHGTALLAIVIAIAILAVGARFALSGIGPFQASVSSVEATGSGLKVTLTVTNQGSRAGSSTCRVHDEGAVMADISAYFLSPQIDPGSTVTFSRETPDLGTVPIAGLSVECATP